MPGYKADFVPCTSADRPNPRVTKRIIIHAFMKWRNMALSLIMTTATMTPAVTVPPKRRQGKQSQQQRRRPRQVVHWILRNENLTQEFASLMKWYNLPVRLPTERVNQGSAGRLTVANLTLETLELIERVYRKDFEAFGYVKETRQPQPLVP